MEIAIDIEVFTQRQRRIAEAADVFRDLDLGSAPPASGVVELAGVDAALAQLHSGVKAVRQSVNEKLDDSHDALSGVQQEFREVEAAQQKRIVKMMAALQ